MYFMYVDESGDTGLRNSPTRFFALSGLVVHESNWRDFVSQIITFRRTMKAVYGLPLRMEIHASEYINKPVLDIKRNDRLSIIRNFTDELAKMPFLSVTNIIVDKTTKAAPYDVFDHAWRTLFQRFENTIRFGNFPGARRLDYGLAITDNTDGKKLTKVVRKMCVYNPIPNDPNYGGGFRNLPIVRVLEDPFLKDSKESYFIQAADVCAFLLFQKYQTNGYMKRRGAQHTFDRLRPILNTNASRTNGFGIVEL